MIHGATSGGGGKLHFAVIDAQPLFRAGVTATLRASKMFETVAEGDRVADALRIAEQQPLDILALDVSIPGGGEVVATLARMWPAIRVVVLTSSERLEDVSSALQSGARGYILKDVDPLELLKALRSVANGEVYMTPSLGARLLTARPLERQPLPQQTQARPADLTHREKQILSHVSVGSTNKEIARELNISEKTVKYYMTNIMQKMHVRNRVEAVVAAREIMRTAN